MIANKRWNVLSGFGMSLAILLTISFLTYPGWGLPYSRAVLADWYASVNINFSQTASAWFPKARFSVGFWTGLILGIVLFLEWIGAVGSHYRRIGWTVCLSLAVTPLMGFAVFPSNHVVLLPSFVLILMLVWERWTKRRVLYTALILLVALLVPYWMYYRVLQGAPEIFSELLTFLPPIATIVALYWMRWWAFRSPRTWFDQIGENA